MRYRVLPVVMVMMALATGVAAQEVQDLSLVEARPLFAARLTATGRVQAVVSARIGARVSGYLAELGADESGRTLDAGMTVKAGQALFRLNDTTFRNTLAVAEASLNSAKASLENLTARTREEQLEQLRQAIAELDVRITDQEREVERYRRLVEQEKTLPARRLEEAQTQLNAQRALRKIAQARLREAENGPTPTEIAVAAARVKEAEAALKIAQDDLRDATVRAPFDGAIVRRFKSPGDYLVNMPPTDVLELVSADKLEVELLIPEAYLAAVRPGITQVVLHSPLLKGQLTLPVGRVVSEVDPARGTFAVRVPIPADRREALVAGAFVTADVSLGDPGQEVIVPLRAVVESDGQSAVFVAEDGKMLRRVVQLGDRLTEGVVVRSGLAAGQKVVVGPAEAMKDGSPLPDYLQLR